MTTQIDALRLALEALNIAIDYMNERLEDHDAKYQRHPATEAERNNILADIESIKEALEQPEQSLELVEWRDVDGTGIPEPVYRLKAQTEQRSVSEHLEHVALMVYRGELCYKSQEDDQSFGMWCPITQDLPFSEGTKFYTTSSKNWNQP